MPNNTKYHEDCGKTVCLLCMKKATRELTEFQAERIKKIYEANFDFQDTRVPRGICQACRKALCRKNEGKDVELPFLINFSTTATKMVHKVKTAIVSYVKLVI